VTTPLTATVLTDADAFAALAKEWDALVAGCSSATAFQAHAWQHSWWRAYGAPGRLRVVLVRVGDRLVAAAALHLHRRGPLRVLRPVGDDVSDFADVLIADDLAGRRPEALDALAAALLGDSGWDALDLPEVRPGAAAAELAARWPARTATTDASVCLELPVQPLPDLLSGLPGKTAKHIRRKLRRIDEVGVEATVVRPEDAVEAVDDLLRFHAAQWAGRGMTAEHGRDRFRQHLRGALPAMVAADQAVLVRFSSGGRPVGVRLNLVGRRLLGAYLSGTDPELRNEIDVAALMMRTNLALAEAAGIETLSLLRGREDYKLRWRPDVVPNSRIVLGRPRSGRATGYVLAARARARVVPWLRERAPWIREARRRVLAALGR
jgi:CelD/BcsL family acetyltransferase involved in cellulose biosynthesis